MRKEPSAAEACSERFEAEACSERFEAEACSERFDSLKNEKKSHLQLKIAVLSKLINFIRSNMKELHELDSLRVQRLAKTRAGVDA